MNFLITAFNEIIFRPILNLLVFVIDVIPGSDLGLAIILVTVAVRILLYPLSHKALVSQKKISQLQPKLKEIQKKYKDDRQKQSEAVMAFYKENNMNPFAGCLPFLIQLPIIIGMYRVFLTELSLETDGLYSFVSAPLYIHTNFLGLINLLEPSVILALLAAFAQFMVSRITFAKRQKLGPSVSGLQGMMGKQMMYVLPLVTFFIAQNFPAGLVLYWFITTVFSFGQQILINKAIKE
ncbi:MAG: hypothetical protein A3H51_01060 [Candidatus Spechtbacteria bacterium RIFCSPLOWO2_02_FULL_38_8]|uniref:Membrane insertase YidC/Oxa/ALB C-terminal domain-containing protein n=1 Tax=Candidatus Spechtbacteria bacterium RIFCSPLOWO2_02_FULL_38_8 TaxID=1802164 RepID=A0A1G2HKP8_9BACT|nr:MAG: hypothetical protein A3H51_01060 [Candidatus Spechtbacteria bacterium RIFCSPLOWO2_02_FULL_38_8]